MTDDLDPSSAASAAFDGEADADERALVEASDALRDEVEFYGTLRAQLRDLEVPAGARESAMSAALAAFDLVHAAPATEPEPTSVQGAPVVSMAARRQRQYGWLGAAAAAVVAILVVGVIARSGGEDHKTSLETPSGQVAITLGSAAKSAPAIQVAPVAGGAAAATTAATTASATAGSTAASTAESTADTTAGTMSAADAAAPSSLFDAFATAPRLDTEDQLVAFASGLTAPITPTPVALSAAGDSATAATTGDTSAGTTATTAAAPTSTTFAPSAGDAAGCSTVGLEPAGAAIYQGRPVYVVRDATAGRIIVIDAATCTITTVIPFPSP